MAGAFSATMIAAQSMKTIFFKLTLPVCVWLAVSGLVLAQAKKAAPAGSASKICDDPYQGKESADGWPEGPVYILFHHQDSKAPWVHNPLIRAPGLEAQSATAAHTLVCVEETRLEMGKYDSGEAGYAPSWNVVLVKMPQKEVYFMKVGFHGEEPPGVKYHRGAGVGKPPIAPFVQWLRLVAQQKVARPKLTLKSKEYANAIALAFSPDGSKLVLAQESRSTLDGTPPSPVTVFDLSARRVLTTLKLDYNSQRVAVSKSADVIVTERYDSTVELWDGASGKMIRKLDTGGRGGLIFGPNDQLGTAGKGKAVVWDSHGWAELRSAKGDYISLSPDGAWITATKDHVNLSVQEMQSGHALGTFPAPADGDDYALSGNAGALASYSILGAHLSLGGKSEPQSLLLPSISMDGLDTIHAVAPTADGFVIGGSDGIAGIISATGKEPRLFATDLESIQAIAVSQDGKLVAFADRGDVSVWELR